MCSTERLKLTAWMCIRPFESVFVSAILQRTEAKSNLKLPPTYSVIGALQDTFLLSRVQKVPYRAPNTRCTFNAVPEMRVFSGALLPGILPRMSRRNDVSFP